MTSRVPVLLLIILNGATNSYTISWAYQSLYSRVLNDSTDLATVSGKLFYGKFYHIYLIILPYWFSILFQYLIINILDFTYLLLTYLICVYTNYYTI